MKKDRIFKKSIFGGFKREDVLNYIDEIKSECAGQKEKNKELCEKCEGLGSELERLENEIKAAAEREKELSDDISKKNDEIAALSARIAQLESENSELLQSSEKYKAIEAQVGSIIVDARYCSDRIIENTRGEIDKFTADYCQTANGISAQMDGVSSELFDVQEKISGIITAVADKFSKLTSHLKSTEKLLLKSNKDYEETASRLKNAVFSENTGYKPGVGEERVQEESAPNLIEFHQPEGGDFDNFTNEYKSEQPQEPKASEPHFSVSATEIGDSLNALQHSSYNAYINTSYNGFVN